LLNILANFDPLDIFVACYAGLSSWCSIELLWMRNATQRPIIGD
jgi:hypothetical protein